MPPRFSIVIPTRNRPETLQATIRTCLAQTFDDYEVIVSDNCSEPRTREVVEAFQSPRLRYLRLESPLAMSGNWEFALSQATGDFITMVGDDDGLLFHALKEADAMIRRLNVEILTARGVFYTWPGVKNPAFADSIMAIPTLGESRMKRSAQVLGDILSQLSNMMQLPSIYNSFVHRNALELIRGRNGNVFNSSIPDWYSGFALASTIDSHAESGVPFRIDGVSSKSTGHDFVRGVPGRVEQEFARLNSANGIEWHSKVPKVSMSVAAIAAECVEQLRDNLRPDDARLVISHRDLMRAIMRDLRNNRHPISGEAWGQYLDELTRSIARNGESEWYERAFGNLDKNVPPPWNAPKPWSVGLYPERLVLDVSQFDVTDVYGAAELFEKIFRRRDFEAESINQASPLARWVSATKDLVRELSAPTVVRAGRTIRKRLAEARERLLPS